jgi:hypothetical protein
MSTLATSSSTSPVHDVSAASSLRYSSAARPTIDALRRSGRSLVTTVTSAPSADRFLATARLRQPREVLVVQLDAERAAGVVHRQRLGQGAVLEAQALECAQRLPGRPAELGVVALGLDLGEHHDREHDVVLLEPLQGSWVGQQD